MSLKYTLTLEGKKMVIKRKQFQKGNTVRGLL